MDTHKWVLLILFCFSMFGLYSYYSIRSFNINDSPPLPAAVRTKNVKSNLYIYMKAAGRLGNLLTEYAATEGMGFYYNRTTYYSKGFRILNQLYYKIDIKIRNKPGETNDIIHESTNQIVVKIKPNKNTTLQGYFQNYFYFNNITNLLMTTFSNFNPYIESKVKKFITDVKKSYYSKTNLPPMTRTESVCIHVRRGDFLSSKSIKLGRTVADKGSIQFAMEYFRNKNPHTFFIFISDAKPWCKSNFQHNDIFFSHFSSLLDDFVLASSCDHSIMTVGTFGWWSSWLIAKRGGKVLYFKKYCKPGSYLSKYKDRNVWFPSNWLAYTKSSVELSKNVS